MITEQAVLKVVAGLREDATEPAGGSATGLDYTAMWDEHAPTACGDCEMSSADGGSAPKTLVEGNALVLARLRDWYESNRSMFEVDPGRGVETFGAVGTPRPWSVDEVALGEDDAVSLLAEGSLAGLAESYLEAVDFAVERLGVAMRGTDKPATYLGTRQHRAIAMAEARAAFGWVVRLGACFGRLPEYQARWVLESMVRILSP